MSRFGSLKISTKFNLIIAACFLAILAANAVDDYHRQQSLVTRDAVDNARIIARQIIQTRDYMSSVVRSEPETNYALVPQVVATQIAKRITEGTKFYVRQVSLRYRNPGNRPDPFEAAMLERFKGHPAQESYRVVDDNGRQVFRYLLSMTAEKSCLGCHGSYDAAPAFVRARFPRGHFSYNYREGEVIGAVSVSIPMEDLYRQIGANLRSDFIFSSGILLLIIALMSWLIGRFIIRPIQAVSASIAHITRTGIFSHRLPVPSGDEIGRLIESFNDMTVELGHRTEQRMESEDRYRKFIEMAASAVITFLDDGKIVIANQRAEELLGLTRQELLGESIFAFLADGDVVRQGIEGYVRDGESALAGLTARCRLRDARGRTLEMEMAVSASKGEERPLFTAIFRQPPT